MHACVPVCMYVCMHLPALLLQNADGSDRVLRNFEFLGAAIGDDVFVHAHTTQRAGKTEELLDAIAELADVQVGLRLLRACAGFARMVHSMRCNPPVAQHSALILFDGLVRRSFGGLTGIHVNAEQWKQAARGLAHAGLGLRSCSTHAASAYLASLGSSLQDCTELDASFSAAEVKASSAAVEALQALQAALPADHNLTIDKALKSKRWLTLRVGTSS